MSFKVETQLDLTNNEILNVRLQNVSGNLATPLEGHIWDDVTNFLIKVRSNGVTEVLPFLSTTAPTTLTIGQVAAVGTSNRAMRADAVFGLPGLATSGTSGFMVNTDKAKLDNATASATASTLILRDSNGRAQVQDPVSGLDISNKQYVDTQVELAKQGLAWKAPVRTIFTTNLAGTYVGGTKRITASVNGVFPNNDGVTTWVIGDRVLLDGQTTATQNGIYELVDVGSAGTPWILVRTDDFGGPGSVAGDILAGAYIPVKEGTEYGDTTWICANDTVVIDTTNINFVINTSAHVDNVTIEVNALGNLQVKDAGISYAKIQNMIACSVLGRSANSTGVSSAIQAASNNTVLARVSDALTFSAVTNAMLATMAAKSVKVNATNATAVPTDLASGTADLVLMTNSANTGLEWATVRTGGITNSSVTYAKIQNVSATNRVLGRVTAGAGVVEELTPANLRAIIGSDITGTAATRVSGTFGDGTNSSYTITHALPAGRATLVQVCRTGTPYDVVLCDIEKATATTVTIRFSRAVLSNEMTYTLIG